MFYAIIVGGGKVGSNLALHLLHEGHEVRVIDHRTELIAVLRSELPEGTVFEGEGSSPIVLEAAGIRRAKVLAAVTQEDDANLVVATLGRFEFAVPRIIARVNDPRNAWMFTPEMGVDVAVNQADILARMIVEEMSLGDMLTLLKLRRGEFSLVEEKLRPTSPALGIPLRHMALPARCVIAAVIRDGRVLVPRGDLTFEADDEVLAIVTGRARDELHAFLA